MENCTYLYCKELSHIGKEDTEFEAWCNIKPKPIINERDFFFLESLTKSIFFYFKKLIVV